MTRRRKRKTPQPKEQWYKVDLHLHSQASADYQEEQTTYLDILQKAERKGLDIIAFTDHNTVAGFRKMHEEIEEIVVPNSAASFAFRKRVFCSCRNARSQRLIASRRFTDESRTHIEYLGETSCLCAFVVSSVMNFL